MILRIVLVTVCGFGVVFMLTFLYALLRDSPTHKVGWRKLARGMEFRPHKPKSSNRALVNGWMFAVAVVTLCPLLMLGQERSDGVAGDLALLVRQKRYIEFARQLEGAQGLSFSDRALFEGILANRRNQVSESIRLLEPLAHTLIEGPADRAELALCSLADDYAKGFRYGDAADTYSLLSRLPGYREDDMGCQAGLEAERWGLLRQSPAQSTTITGPFTLDENRTAAGLLEVVVRAPKFSDRWILDTGANLSAVTRTVAAQLGLTLSAATSTAQGSSGIFVRIHTAVVPEIQIGRATIRNFPVLVFEDHDLSFPQLSYQIHGSIGFPVLQSLGRITFHADGRFAVHEPSSHQQSDPANLYLEGFTVLIETEIEGKQHLLTLDTGATGTFLSGQYYEEHKHEFDAEEPRELELIGAGGSSIIHAYVLPDVTFKIGGGYVELHDIYVLTEPTGLPAEFSGNLGQSSVGLLSSYTLDFRNMTLSADARSTTGRNKASRGRAN
jgi:Aspartyl protease